MNFDPTEEQALLRASVEKVLAASQERDASSVGQKIAELGLFALPFAEADGGLGGTLADICIVMDCFGRGRVAEPYLASTLLGGKLVARLGTPAQKAAWLPRLMAGKARLCLAHAERGAPAALSFARTQARRTAAGYTLDGAKTFVLDGAQADGIVVLARSAGDASERDGLSAFLVPPGQARIRPYRLADGSLAAEMTFEQATLGADALLGPEGGAFDAFESMVGRASVAVTAEALGLMEALMGLTLEHLRTRKQFGVALASFQVLRHRMADCAVALEQARSLHLKALIDDAGGSRGARLRSAFGAKALAFRAARAVAAEAVQMHGAMGLTEELKVGRYLKRLLVLESLFGDPRVQLDRYNALAEAV